jgi:Mg-chelatase subunit ChlD
MKTDTTTTTTTAPIIDAPTETATLARTTTAVDRLNGSLKKGGLRDFVKSRRRSLLLVDCSGSMADRIQTGERKIDALRTVVTNLRTTHPVPVAAFGSRSGAVVIVETVPEPHGNTPLDKAIDFGAQAGATHLCVVTDGQPNSEALAFDAADRFGKPVDVFYIGNGHDYGLKFAQELARRTGGTCHLSDLGKPKELEQKIAGLLGDGGAL